MFEFIKKSNIVNGISKGFSSMAGYIKSIDYRSKYDNTKTIVSGLFAACDLPEQDIQDQEDITGCVGKLPVYADFIRVNLSIKEALVLDKWIQNGFVYLGQKRMETFKQVFNRFPDFNFLLFGDSQHKTVAGVMVPGQDQSGREYPFVIFKILGQRYRSDQISLIPLLVDQFHQSALKLCREDWSEQSKELLVDAIEQLPKNSGQATIESLHKNSSNLLDLHPAESLWISLLDNPGVETRAEYIQIFNHKIRDILISEPEAIKWGIEITLYDYSKAALVQLFFVTLLEKMLDCVAWRGQCWLTETSEDTGRLIIFFRPLQTHDLLTLIDFEYGRGSLFVIEDLLHESEGELKEELRILDGNNQMLATLSDEWVGIHKNWLKENIREVVA